MGQNQYKARFSRSIQRISPESGSVIIDPTEAIKVWNNHFADLCKAPTKDNPIRGSEEAKLADTTDHPISWSEISNVLHSLRNNKAIGIDDQIPAEVFKLVEHEKRPDHQ